MNRRTTRTRTRVRRGGMPAVLAATGALLLGACGGDGGGSSDEIKGADKGGDSSSAPASPSASERETTDGIKRPVIKLGEGAENVFEKADTGDSAKDAVLADSQRAVNASDQVITRQTGVKTLEFYSKGQALLDANEYVKSWVKAGRSWVGKTRYYDRTAQLHGKDEATVKYCIDESDSRTKVLKTGKVLSSNASKKSFGYVTVQMERNEKGVWQQVSGGTESEAERCMP